MLIDHFELLMLLVRYLKSYFNRPMILKRCLIMYLFSNSQAIERLICKTSLEQIKHRLLLKALVI